MSGDAARVYRLGDWLVEGQLNRISRPGEEQRLEGKTMDVLLYLAAHAGAVVTTEELLGAIWPGRVVEESSIHRRINQIRRALGDDQTPRRYIETIVKRGYRVIAEVSQRNAPPAAPASGATLSVPSIAVLPFVNLGDTDDYFGEGVAEELLNRMIRLGDIRVISRHSSFAYGDSALDVREIGKQLGANYLLQGSVRRDTGIVRIAVYLTDSAAGTEIWANSYDRELADMLRVQDEIAQVVVGELLPNIMVTPSVQPAVDPLAYEVYLQARVAIAANDPMLAKPLLQSAITLDDEFSNAYAALADVYESLRIYGFPIFVGDEELQRVLDKALEFDPENIEALAVEAILEFYIQSDMAKAVSKFERLLRGSSNTRALHHYRQLLIAMGKFEDLLLIAKRRRELDPYSRITVLTEFWAYMWLGEFSLARKTANRVPLEAVSESGWSGRRPWLIFVDLATGQHEAAEANLSLLGPEFDEQGRLYFQLWLAIERGDLDGAKELYAANPIAISAMPFQTWLPFDAALTGDISRTIDEIEQPTDPRSIVWITQLRSRERWVSEHTAPIFGEAFESLRRDQRYGRALESYGIDDVSLSQVELHSADLWD